MPPRHAYIHVPFCARRCSYCDFAIAVRRAAPVDEYLEALGRELTLRAPAGAPWELDTLYFGGGTPSRLGGEGVARMVELVRRHAALAPGAEVTLEANPDDVTPAAARAWVAAGINRVSLGVQSFDAGVLRWMHRTHDVAAIYSAVEALRAGGIGNYSLDLIFALPAALGRDWSRDLREALALDPAHVSLYGLTVEAHTPLARWRSRGDVEEAPEEAYEREFLEAHDAVTAAGFDHYEVSNFGRPGRHSRHNASYWAGVPYAGLGPGAHAFDGARRSWNESAYARWRDQLAGGGDPEEGGEKLTAANRAAEGVYLGLRTSGGLRLEEGEEGLVRPWLQAGWGRLGAGGRLVLTAEGWLRLDALAGALTASRSRY